MSGKLRVCARVTRFEDQSGCRKTPGSAAPATRRIRRRKTGDTALLALFALYDNCRQ